MSENRKEQFKLRFEKYYPMLCKIANGYIADQDDCEDIVQTLFINVWDKQKDALPEEEMLAYIKMSKLQKMKYKEIAERLNISEKTVENHIGKAIKIIRAYIAANPIIRIVTIFISIALNL